MDEEKKDYKSRVEALLFASGRFMGIDTLVSLARAPGREEIKESVDRLRQEYEQRNSPLMIVEEKEGWKITVREAFLPLVRKIVSETELPKTILETLAVVAWKAPVWQSEIVKIRHSKAYDHIEELEELGFIKKEKKGRSFMLKLAEKFYDYFDIEGAKDIRQVFSRVVERAGRKEAEALEKKAPETAADMAPEKTDEEQKPAVPGPIPESAPEEKKPGDEKKEDAEFSEL